MTKTRSLWVGMTIGMLTLGVRASAQEATKSTDAAQTGPKPAAQTDASTKTPKTDGSTKTSNTGSSAKPAAKSNKTEPVPSNLALLKSLKKTWSGVSCTGQMAVVLGGEPVLSAPFAIANQNDTLKWAVFVTPPAPCGGTVVLGDMKLGPGHKAALEMGIPPAMVTGKKAATLDWKKLERKSGAGPVNAASLCGAQGGGGDSSLFSLFASGVNQRPDNRSWDPEHAGWLKLEGDLKSEDPTQTGHYTAWLDKTHGYLPVKQVRTPDRGAPIQTVYEAKEVAPGKWLPVRWEVSGVGRPTMIGELKELRCDRPLPPAWFDKKTYPDVSAQTSVIQEIRTKP